MQRWSLLPVAVGMLVISLAAQAKPAPRDRDQGADRDDVRPAPMRGADARLAQIAEELKLMRQDMRRMNDRIDELQGHAAARPPQPKGKPEAKRERPGKDEEAMGPMRQRMREMVQQRMEDVRRQFRPSPDDRRDRFAPPMRPRRDMEQRGEHPLLDRLMPRLRERLDAIRHDGRGEDAPGSSSACAMRCRSR